MGEELSKDVFKEQRKGLAKYFHKLPKSLRWLLFIASYVVTLLTGNKLPPLNLNLNQLGIVNIQSNQKVEGAQTSIYNSCPVKFCSDFGDKSNWTNIERFVALQDAPLILKSPNSSSLPGATMFYNQSVGSFSMQTSIIPESTVSANIVVAYGHLLRCIVGDSDYSTISCQINDAYPKKIEDWSYIDTEGGLHGKNKQYQFASPPLSPNKELHLQFGMGKINGITTINIQLNEEVPLQWKLPTNLEGTDTNDFVGLGLITNNLDDVQAVFKKFQLDPHL